MVSHGVQPDAVVLGGGPIGLATAWRAAQRGMRVEVLDAGVPAAWTAAAGMLAPATEAEYGEKTLLELGLRSAAAYEGFASELAEASGRDPGFRRACVGRSRSTSSPSDWRKASSRSSSSASSRSRATTSVPPRRKPGSRPDATASSEAKFS